MHAGLFSPDVVTLPEHLLFIEHGAKHCKVQHISVYISTYNIYVCHVRHVNKYLIVSNKYTCYMHRSTLL